MDILGTVQSRATKMIKGMEYLSCRERLRELGQFSLERGRCRENLIHVYKYPNGGSEEDRVKVCSVVLSDRARGDGCELKKVKFGMNTRKHFLL